MDTKKTRKPGRPSKYRKEFVEQAYKLCLLGATDKQLADFFKTTEAAINRWKTAHPEFRESLKAGKIQADAEIAKSLYHRALGYEHPEDDIRALNGGIVITPTIKHYPPDTTAAIFWLKNRQPAVWRDRQELDHRSSDGSMTPKPLLDVSKLSQAARKEILDAAGQVNA